MYAIIALRARRYNCLACFLAIRRRADDAGTLRELQPLRRPVDLPLQLLRVGVVAIGDQLGDACLEASLEDGLAEGFRLLAAHRFFALCAAWCADEQTLRGLVHLLRGPFRSLDAAMVLEG